MISYDKRCIFIHIPKCGGTSIENIIWPDTEQRTERNLWMGFVSKYHNKYQTGGLQHLLARQVLEEVGKDVFDSFYKFVIVRNPWDRIVSQFAYMQMRPDLMDFIGMNQKTEFKHYLDLIQKKQHVQWMPQTEFILGKDGKLLVDMIGHIENFEEDSLKIFNKLGLYGAKSKVGHAKRSKRKKIDFYYSDLEAIEMVGQIFSSDIEYFGYSFSGLLQVGTDA